MQIRFLGSANALRAWLQRWPQIEVTGGHTMLAIDPASPSDVGLARDIYSTLVTEHKWSPIDTTVKEAPKRADASSVDPGRLDVTEITLIPPIVGG